MTAQIIQFPQEVRDDVAMARHVMKACERRGWDMELEEAMLIARESRRGEDGPGLESIARRIASDLGIALRPELE